MRGQRSGYAVLGFQMQGLENELVPGADLVAFALLAACVFVFAALFLMRFTFYMSHLTADLGV